MQRLLKSIDSRVLGCAALIVLFTLLSYLGAVIYFRAGGLTTLKPLGGFALALCLIYGRNWVWPIFLTSLIGGIISKLFFHDTLGDHFLGPSLASVTLLATYHLCQRFIGPSINFRAWRQLIAFIIIVACAAALSAVPFAGKLYWWGGQSFWDCWKGWFLPTTLSYVIFTPTIMLLLTAKPGAFRNNMGRLAISLSVLIVALACNFLPLQVSILYLIPLALLLITLMSGVEGVALGLVLTQLVLTTATLSGHGIAHLSSFPIGMQLYYTQMFMSSLIVVLLPAAAAISQGVTLREEMLVSLRREEETSQALRESERRCREIANQAECANKAKSEFLANMSHELRTPLNAILGFSEVLATQLFGPLGNAKYSEYAADVYKSGAHLLELINDILDLSKIDAGKMDLNESCFAVSQLIEDTVHLVRSKAAGHVKVRVRAPSNIFIVADKRLTKQILVNLLSNAIKFTPDGGTITVGFQERQRLGLEIYVADTGIGMTEAQLEKAFSPYGQVNSQIAQDSPGTGLGIPIAQSLARLHGGDLVAQSMPGRGTRMMFMVPQCRIAEIATNPRIAEQA